MEFQIFNCVDGSFGFVGGQPVEYFFSFQSSNPKEKKFSKKKWKLFFYNLHVSSKDFLVYLLQHILSKAVSKTLSNKYPKMFYDKKESS